MGDGLSEMFSDQEFSHSDSLDDLFSIIETFEEASKDAIPFTPFEEPIASPRANTTRLASQRSNVRLREANDVEAEEFVDDDASLSRKKIKFAAAGMSDIIEQDGQHKVSHITVERNRRKQMNEHLTVLRSLMPSFYVKRGDQASIIGAVVDYIKELQQVMNSLQSKKQRKAYSEVLSPRSVSSPRPSPLSPRPSPLSPRMALPISPRTPQPGSPYKPRMQHAYISPCLSPYNSPSPSLEVVTAGEVAANSKSAVADVEVKFSGPNLVLKTVSHRIPGQAMKIITALEAMAFEILHVSINSTDEAMLNSFTVKIGIECELSAEELAQEIQQTFS